MHIKLLTVVALASVLWSTAPAAQDSSEAQATDVPTNGMTMARVREHHGEPSSVRPAVGDPPITRWVYEDFTVYFEHDRVIHSVSR